jgi:hypothetical protein
VTLRTGLLHERAAVEFWTGIASHAGIADATSQAEGLGARSATNEARQETGY